MKTIEKKSIKLTNINYLTFIFGTLLLVISSCSTQKNTKITRAYHNLTARFNVYFNGKESLKAGDLRLKNDYKENYAHILPIFRYENPEAAKLVGADMDRTIKKCAKTIKVHSITVKPKIKKKNYSREEQAFLAQAEYCKWIDNAYLLMAKSHFYKREFEAAKQMLFLVINKYKSEDSKYEAMLWLAKCYAELEEYNSAENTLIDLRKVKKYDKKFKIKMDLVFASMFMKQHKYTEAANSLSKVVEVERKRKEKTRHLFILGQIYQSNDKYKLAENYYKKVIKKNPNYDMTFMAKIRLAEIFEKSGGDANELKKQLNKMTKDEKNIDYLDQIYYALGKIELNEKNREKAIEYFTLSAQATSSNDIQKVKTHLALAEYYYDTDNLKYATAYYDSTYNSIQEEFPDYKKVFPQIENRHSITQELYSIFEQDSLQKMANMSEKERNKIIDGLIQNIVNEEEKQKAEKASHQSMGYDPVFDSDYGTRPTNPTQGGKYYFYNPSTISLGMNEFKKKWGDRRLSDNWRRSNKQVNSNNDTPADVEKDATANIDNTSINEEKKVTNIKSREYYLQGLPLDSAKMRESNNIIQEALFNSAQIYAKKMNSNTKAIEQLELLIKRFPKTSYRKESLYQLYKLYTQELNKEQAVKYKEMIINEFPESIYAKLLKDPEFSKNLMQSERQAESTYEELVQKYKSKEYSQCITLSDSALSLYPNSDLKPHYIYMKAISYGEMGNKNQLRENLEIITKEYPNTELAGAAQGTIDVLNTKKFDKDLYTLNKDTAHYYILIFNKEKVDVNRLSFNYKSFNLEHYTQDNLEVNVISLDDKREMLVVRTIKNGYEAEKYLHEVVKFNLFEALKKHVSSQFVISPNNYQDFLKNKIETKYLDFYKKNYN